MSGDEARYRRIRPLGEQVIEIGFTGQIGRLEVLPVLERQVALAQEVAPMRALWRAVLVQALREARGNIVNTGGAIPPKSRTFEHRRAVDWIGSRDFRAVCELAGVELTEAEVRAALAGPKGDLLIRNSRHDR